MPDCSRRVSGLSWPRLDRVGLPCYSSKERKPASQTSCMWVRMVNDKLNVSHLLSETFVSHLTLSGRPSRLTPVVATLSSQAGGETHCHRAWTPATCRESSFGRRGGTLTSAPESRRH